MYSNEFQEIINRRRSNRKFDPLVEVPAEVIKRSLERAILSPNSSNMQLWEFYWIRSEEEKKKYGDLCLGQNAAKTAKEIVLNKKNVVSSGIPERCCAEFWRGAAVFTCYVYIAVIICFGGGWYIVPRTSARSRTNKGAH